MLSINADSLITDLTAIRQAAPLVHNITNFVVMQQTANALLALGASPIMAHASNEIKDLLGIVKALVINIGTLDDYWLQSMQQALLLAKQQSIPIIFDPVGAGATRYRTVSSQYLISQATPSVIRGNASEILSIGNQTEQATKGVDSAHSVQDAVATAGQLAKTLSCCIVISGPMDICVTEKQLVKIKNGSSMMTKVTGMGCTATALIGAFCAINPEPLLASAHAMAVMGIVGEIAAERSQGPGSFHNCFLDTLFNLSHSDISKKLRIEID